MFQNDHSKIEVTEIMDIEKRFVSYISSMLHYNAMNFDKKNRKYNDRFSLIFDEVIDTLASNENDLYTDHPFEKLENQISDLSLHEAFMTLTERERKILNLSFCYTLSDTEIAVNFSVSQQSISNSRKNALRKLRKSIERGEDND